MSGATPSRAIVPERAINLVKDGRRLAPDYSSRKRPTQCKTERQALPAASHRPLACRPPPDPLPECLLPRSGPERNRHVPVPASFRARLSGSRAGNRGDTNRRSEMVRCQSAEMWELSTVTWRLGIQGTSACRVEAVKESAGAFVRLEKKGTDLWRRLEERLRFPMQNRPLS
jgi:hypothetical protein